MAPAKVKKSKQPASQASVHASEDDREEDRVPSPTGSVPGAFEDETKPEVQDDIDDEDRRPEVTTSLTVKPAKISAVQMASFLTQGKNIFATPKAVTISKKNDDHPTDSTGDDAPEWVLDKVPAVVSTSNVKQENSELPLRRYTSLTAVKGPLSNLYISSNFYGKETVDFPAARPTDKRAQNSPEVIARRKQALDFGYDYTHRHLSDIYLSRTDRINFKILLQLLNKILTEVETYTDATQKGYKVDKSEVIAFGHVLLTMRTAAQENLELAGDGIPGLPKWGQDNNLNVFWDATSFEILAACYRAETIQFLARLGEVYDYKELAVYEDNFKRNKQESQESQPPPKQAPEPTAETRAPNSRSQPEPQPQIQIQMQPATQPTTQRDQAHHEIKTNPFEQMPQERTESSEDARRREASEERFRKSEVIRQESISMFKDAPRTTKKRGFVNQSASIFGGPSQHTSSKRLSELLQPSSTPRKPSRSEDTGGNRERQSGGAPNPDDPDDSDEGENNNRRDEPRRTPRLPRQNPTNGNSNTPPSGPPSGPPDPGSNTNANVTRAPTIPQFDNKLKVDIIPKWDGNPDELGRWIMKVNRLSERSELVYQQLGYLVPTRLTGPAEIWYYSLDAAIRSRTEEDWGSLRSTIAGYYMNRTFIEKQRIRANKASYREGGYTSETPSEYFIRKSELLELVYNYSEGELINEVMSGAPSYWTTILAPHLYETKAEFQMAIKFQEDNLLRIGGETYRQKATAGYLPRDFPSRNPFNSYRTPNTNEARVNAVGWNKNLTSPPFPKDDKNVSPKGTPVSQGGRPCRHCGSDNHWDPECQYARKGEKRARVNAASITMEEQQSQQDYEELYYSLISDDEDDSEQDFRQTPRA